MVTPSNQPPTHGGVIFFPKVQSRHGYPGLRWQGHSCYRGQVSFPLTICWLSALTHLRGSAGIGFAVIQQLVRHGAKVYMGARNLQRAKAAIERLHADCVGSDNEQAVWLDLDLSDPRKVQKAAEEVMQREGRLDVLSKSFGPTPLSIHVLTNHACS